MSKMISFVDSDSDKLVVETSSSDGDLYFQVVPSSKSEAGGIVRLESAQIEALIQYLAEFQDKLSNPDEKWPGYIDITEDQ